MRSKISENNNKMKKKPEMKNDGHDHERFRDLLKTIVKVPKDEIKKEEERQKKEKKRNAS